MSIIWRHFKCPYRSNSSVFRKLLETFMHWKMTTLSSGSASLKYFFTYHYWNSKFYIFLPWQWIRIQPGLSKLFFLKSNFNSTLSFTIPCSIHKVTPYVNHAIYGSLWSPVQGPFCILLVWNSEWYIVLLFWWIRIYPALCKLYFVESNFNSILNFKIPWRIYTVTPCANLVLCGLLWSIWCLWPSTSGQGINLYDWLIVEAKPCWCGVTTYSNSQI